MLSGFCSHIFYYFAIMSLHSNEVEVRQLLLMHHNFYWLDAYHPSKLNFAFSCSVPMEGWFV